ncbi:unnamed protein product [Prorocentrum cordatum]|uniref:Fe2OG dioxygenase domain-containing protein n=1 Tax=Prorocentrum cordatum TaxID=2364126 RepID=A0ABN9SS76_9DINO|nr:unnamed protein product [Polarella glacialis]
MSSFRWSLILGGGDGCRCAGAGEEQAAHHKQAKSDGENHLVSFILRSRSCTGSSATRASRRGWRILDRRYSLNYHHTAYRVELPMRAHCRDLYSHLVDTMVWADQLVWKRLARNETVYPQAEYIVYDARDGEPGTIEPHVDNNSAVSMIVLLSDPSEFSGGTNYFDGDGACPGSRPLDLQRGDAVLFRGEKLMHWISSVTGGVRVILQIELCRV